MSDAMASKTGKSEQTNSILLSAPIENLLDRNEAEIKDLYCDVLIVGSGYGGSVAAMTIAQCDNPEVWVLERGREYGLGEFPESIGELPGHIRFQRTRDEMLKGDADALFDIRVYEGISVLVGSGLGGTSLINASVVLEPPAQIFQRSEWPLSVRSTQNFLQSEFSDIKKLLGARQYRKAEKLEKFAALSRLADSLGNATCVPATIAVTEAEGANAVGVKQSACVDCGNCITGCNYGAKNTLTMNAIPLARSRGAKFYTGATVVAVQHFHGAAGAVTKNKKELRWTVSCERTGSVKSPHPDKFAIHAHTVILAAGTLGSTEILLRSKEVAISREVLGKHFNGNGDFLAASYAQKERVNAVADANLKGENLRPGPTIVGIIQRDGDDGLMPENTVVEDGTVPSVLSTFMGTLFATLSMAQRFVKDELPAWVVENAADFMAAPFAALEHTQILLGIGSDDADKKVEYQLILDEEHGQLRTAVGKPAAPLTPPCNDRLHDALTAASAVGGFSGGDYFPNPLWQPLPDGFDEISVAGTKHPSSITVHPLGGCVMADSALAGVVDEYGNVFDTGNDNLSSTKRHAGLYVLDGSIMPTALGVNPLLTISALALRSAKIIARELRVEPPEQFERVNYVPYRMRERDSTAKDNTVAIEFTEWFQTTGPLQLPTAWAKYFSVEQCSTIESERGLVAKVIFETEDVWRWLQSPEQKWPARIELYPTRATNAELIHEIHLDEKVASGTGEIFLLRLDIPESWFKKIQRGWQVLKTFFRRRQDIWSGDCSFAKIAKWIRNPSSLWNDFKKFVAAVKGVYRWLLVHMHWRELSYDFDLNTGGKNPLTFTLRGRKLLAYALDQKNPWTALVELDFSMVSTQNRKERVDGTFEVDVLGMIRKRRLQVTKAPDTPTGIAALTAVGAMFIRALITTHLWTLRGLSYDKLPPESDRQPRQANAIRWSEGVCIEPKLHILNVSETRGSNEKVQIQLTAYRSRKGSNKPLLMIHGLALSGESFTTQTIDCNMAEYFVREGYDVWILDFRISARLQKTNKNPYSLDDIGEFDIPAAVKAVYEKYNCEPIFVFAHCMGAATFEMAALSGKLHDEHNKRSMIGKVALHAAHPWMAASLRNRISGGIGAFYRDLLNKPVAEVSPPCKAGLVDELLDRVGASIPWPEAGADCHEKNTPSASVSGSAICNRMALFYGRSYVHDNLDPRTHADFHTLAGPTNFSVFRQMYFFVLRQRLTNQRGENAYLTAENLRKHWTFETLFAHGIENDEFNPSGALRSYEIFENYFPTAKSFDLMLMENVGHLDFLFGRNLSRAMIADDYERGLPENGGCGVFDGLKRFYAGEQQHGVTQALKQQWLSGHSQHIRAPIRPCVGPNFNYRIEDNEIVLQIWLEQSPYASWDLAPPTASNCNVDFVNLSEEWKRRRGVNLPGQFWSGEYRIPKNSGDKLEDIDIWMQFHDPLTQIKGSNAPFSLLLGGRMEISRFKSDAIGIEAPIQSGIPRRTATLWFAREAWFKKLLSRHSARKWSILAGSCCWPGTIFESEAVDQLYGAMLQQVESSRGGIDALWLLGDQIYADASANILDMYEPNERYAARYRDAFSGEALVQEFFFGRHLAALMTKLPTWMVIDDHEIDDDWQGLGSHDPVTQMFSDAFAAAVAYQWRRPPVTIPTDSPLIPPTKSVGLVRGLWHDFKIGELPCFAMDTRTERQIRSMENWRNATLISGLQLAALTCWLVTMQKADSRLPKFILCGSPIGLVTKRENLSEASCVESDTWSGYPASARVILQFIASHSIENVFFVSGDPHFSAVSTIALQAPDKLIYVHSIVLSGFNATVPFANARLDEYLWGNIRLPNLGLDAVVSPLHDAPRQFGRIDVDCSKNNPEVTVGVFDSSGTLLKQKKLNSSQLQIFAPHHVEGSK